MEKEKGGLRNFTEKQRLALFMVSGGKCELCGSKLDRSFHADHAVPWVNGGVTDVTNGQALCQRCNLLKGSKMSGVRLWQQRFVKEYNIKNKRDYLLVATPAAGKTRAAGEVAKILMTRDIVKSVIIIVPTRNLKTQWKNSLHEMGIEIHPDITNSNLMWGPDIPADFHGIAITYQQVAENPDLFRKVIHKRPSLVVFDEIHHCGDKGDVTHKDWAIAIRQAFDGTVKRLALSGTPFRSDNNTIPFVDYVDGVGVPDFSYGYDEALRDCVCRPVYFPRYDGIMEWENMGDVHSATFADEINDELSRQRLRAAISPSGGWMREIIGVANQKLTFLRRDDPRAGGLIIAADMANARLIAGLCRDVVGREPVYVASDDSESERKIAYFRESTDAWMVAVKMVSEGVDIKRLRVGVYATNTLTELFFRQVVGRFVRWDDESPDNEAFVFIPDDPYLRSWAEEIKKDREHILDADLPEDDHSSDDIQVEGERTSRFELISSQAILGGLTVDGSSITAEEYSYAQQLQRSMMGLGSNVSPEQIAVVIRLHEKSGIRIQHPIENRQPKCDRILQLRRENDVAVKKIARKTRLHWKDVNDELNRQIGIKSIRDISITEKQLSDRLERAKTWLRELAKTKLY